MKMNHAQSQEGELEKRVQSVWRKPSGMMLSAYALAGCSVGAIIRLEVPDYYTGLGVTLALSTIAGALMYKITKVEKKSPSSSRPVGIYQNKHGENIVSLDAYRKRVGK